MVPYYSIPALNAGPISNHRPALAQACLSSCRRLIAQLHKIKSRILADFRYQLDEHQHVLELALNEAEAMAWQTGFPQLLFPVLAEEQAQKVAKWHARQAQVRQTEPAPVHAG